MAQDRSKRRRAERGPATAVEEAPRRRRLGEILVTEGVLAEQQLEDALVEQQARGRRERLGTLVVELGLCAEDDVADALAHQLGYSRVNLIEVGPEEAALARVPRKLAERHHALPLRIEDGDVLVVAMSDPTNVVALDDLRLTSGMRAVRPFVATATGVSEALRRAYGADQTALEMVDALHDDSIVAVEEDLDFGDLSTLVEGAAEQPVVRLANAILADAVRTRSSDIHVEPERDGVRIRYRIDGLLREKMRVPRHIGPALVSRLKIMSQLDIAERRRPQDGRTVIRAEGQEVDLRVSTMPTLFGETVVLRLLRKGAERLGIDDIGMPSDTLAIYRQALTRPQGLIICTGPTGSGKTTTLYAGLSELADPVRNVITLEDPVEYQMGGVNQTQINPKVGLTFARGLRTVLRQDPDVVMVGEIRDQETAELAMEASFTGHLVLSTLHTNDAPSSVVRLVDLGVERFLIASSLVLVIAQRLVRVNCPHCTATAETEPRVLWLLGLTEQDLEGKTLVAGQGCTVCDHSGFLGRTAVYEMLAVTPQMRELIIGGGAETAVARLARSQGMRTLREDGLLKAFAGVTTLEEVLRATPEESTTVSRCPECNYLVGEDFVACPNCQADLGGTTCANCRRTLETTWATCPYCNTPTGAAAAPARPPNVVVPKAAPQVVPPATGDGQRAGSSGADGHAAAKSGPQPTILVVDDDDSVRNLVGVILVDDHEVLEAEDGEGALAMAHEHVPDAIILDYRLPDIDGVEVVRKLRADDGTRRIPIVMITGVADPAVEVEGLLAGVDDYITKPFDEDVLRARLRAAMLRAERTR